MSISIVREGITEAITPERQHNWVMKLTSTSNEAGLDANVFVYHAALNGDTIEGDTFECIASAQQMSELPVGVATSTSDTTLIPYYRTNIASVFCRSEQEAEDTFAAIIEDVNDLIRNFRSFSNLNTSETVVCEG